MGRIGLYCQNKSAKIKANYLKVYKGSECSQKGEKMKQNPDFFLNETAGLQIIIPVGKASVKFPGMITVNETGAFLWELLAQERTEKELADALEERFEAPRMQIEADVSEFLRRLKLAGALCT